MNDIQAVEKKLVDFNGAEIMAVQTNDGNIYAGVSWICKGIGFNKSQKDTQVQKVQTDLVLKRGCLKFKAGVIDPNNEVVSIELGFLPMWLAKISITPKMQEESPKVVENLVEYQLKAKDVLAEAFIKKQKTATQAELIAMMAQNNVEQERRLSQVELQVIETKKEVDETKKKQDNIVEILSLNPTEWRKKVNTMLNRIATSLGGFQEYQNIRNESYQLLEERAKCNLSTRLENKKRKMALEGVAKSKIDKVNKMDVIADDARLTEIYLAVVKEMAIKYRVNLENIS